MAVEELWGAIVMIGLACAMFLFLIWINRTKANHQWLRSISCLILGTFLGCIIGEYFSEFKDAQTVYFSVFMGYVLSFLLICTKILEYLFGLIPTKIQLILKCIFIGLCALMLSCIIFKKSIKFAIVILILIIIITFLRALIFKKISSKKQKLIDFLGILLILILLTFFIINNFIKMSIVIAITIVIAVAIL